MGSLGVVPARVLEFDYHARLRAFSFDAHRHAFDAPREIDDATADEAWAMIEEFVEERIKRAEARLRAIIAANRAKSKKRKAAGDGEADAEAEVEAEAEADTVLAEEEVK